MVGVRSLCAPNFQLFNPLLIELPDLSSHPCILKAICSGVALGQDQLETTFYVPTTVASTHTVLGHHICHLAIHSPEHYVQIQMRSDSITENGYS